VEARAPGSRVRLGAGGAATSTVFNAKKRQTLKTFLASPSRLAFDFAEAESGGRGVDIETPDLRAGPPAGPFTKLPSSCVSRGIADLEGSLFAGYEPGCGGQDGPTGTAQGFVFRDLEAQTRTALDPPELSIWDRSDLAVAGSYLAYADLSTTGPPTGGGGITVAVIDRTTGALVYRTQKFPRAQALAFDLRDDGTMVVTYASGKNRGLFRYSIEQPQPTRIKGLLRSTQVRLVGDRVLVERRLADGRGALSITSLSGGASTVARFAPAGKSGIERVGTFDFDGTRVVWAQRQVSIRKVRVRGRTVRRATRGPVRIVVRSTPAP